MTIIRDHAIAIIVGMAILLLLSKLIGRVQFSVGTAFWCSLIGHLALSGIAFVGGFLFYNHLTAVFLIALAFTWAFQAELFQIALKSEQDEILQGWRAGILSGIVILGDFIITSPLIEWCWGTPHPSP